MPLRHQGGGVAPSPAYSTLRHILPNTHNANSYFYHAGGVDTSMDKFPPLIIDVGSGSHGYNASPLRSGLAKSPSAIKVGSAAALAMCIMVLGGFANHHPTGANSISAYSISATGTSTALPHISNAGIRCVSVVLWVHLGCSSVNGDSTCQVGYLPLSGPRAALVRPCTTLVSPLPHICTLTRPGGHPMGHR